MALKYKLLAFFNPHIIYNITCYIEVRPPLNRYVNAHDLVNSWVRLMNEVFFFFKYELPYELRNGFEYVCINIE